MNEEDKMQLIEDYINGQLSLQAKANFQQQLQADPSLAQEVELYRNLFKGIEESGRRDLKTHFKSLENSLSADNPFQQPLAAIGVEQPGREITPRWGKNLRWISGVAACLIAGLFAILWFTQANSADALFKEHYEPYPNLISSTVRGEISLQDRKELAMRAYENGAYAQAVQELKTILSTDADSSLLQLYVGIAYIETSELDSAKTYLRKAAFANSQVSNQAKWYLALAYLKNNEKEAAKLPLQVLRQGTSAYAERAAKLLEKLD